MTDAQREVINQLAYFLKQQMHVGRTPTVRKTAIEHYNALNALIDEHRVMIAHISTCPIAKAEADRGNVSMRENGGDVPPHSGTQT